MNPTTTAGGNPPSAVVVGERLEHGLAELGLPVRTSHSKTRREEHRVTLAWIPERAYAFTDEGRIEGQRAVGVQILIQNGDVIAAISAFGP